jgi:uncharacterized membrane protein YdjX (TVP38/TMEM64 family)
VLAGLILLGRFAGPYVQTLPEWVEGLGVWGPAVFIVGYALAVVAFAPASLLTIAAGAIFGIAAGVTYVFAAAVIGSSLAFLISRYLARNAIERQLAGNQKFAAIDRAVGQQGRRIVFLLRLSPVLPFNLLNYALGLTSVRFADYLIASIGMLPGTLLYVYAGKTIAALTSADRSTWLLVGVGLLPVIIVTVLITRIARRALAEATGGAAA